MFDERMSWCERAAGSKERGRRNHGDLGLYKRENEVATTHRAPDRQAPALGKIAVDRNLHFHLRHLGAGREAHLEACGRRMAAYLNKPQRVLDVVGIGKAEVRYLVRDPRNWNAIPSRFLEPLRPLRDVVLLMRQVIHRNRNLARPSPPITKRAYCPQNT